MTLDTFSLAAPFAAESASDSTAFWLIAIPVAALIVIAILTAAVQHFRYASIVDNTAKFPELAATIAKIEADEETKLAVELSTMRGGRSRASRESNDLDTETAIDTSVRRTRQRIAAVTDEYATRDERRFGRRSTAVAWIAAVVVVVVSSIVIIPILSSVAEDNNALDAAWEAERADWALEKYGVTAGMSDLETPRGVLFGLPTGESPGGRVIAQDSIVDVSLEFIGDEPVLLLVGDINNELPLLGEEPAKSAAAAAEASE